MGHSVGLVTPGDLPDNDKRALAPTVSADAAAKRWETRDGAASQQPLARMCAPEEIASVAIFLATPGAAFMTVSTRTHVHRPPLLVITYRVLTDYLCLWTDFETLLVIMGRFRQIGCDSRGLSCLWTAAAQQLSLVLRSRRVTHRTIISHRSPSIRSPTR